MKKPSPRPFPAVSPRLILLAGLAVVGLAALLAMAGRPVQPLRAASPPYLTIFLLDGLSQDVFEAELAAGNLPNIARLIDEGLYVRNGVAAFPSMTGYGYYPFLTGWMPRGAASWGCAGSIASCRAATSGITSAGRTSR